jgi:UDP-galactopyranose mutase
MPDDVDLLVCGAGPVGCVVAERAAAVLGWNVLVLDKRCHVAGNCHDSHHRNGVLIHNYGPHYFRTNDARLVKYLSRFTEWVPGRYEVKSWVDGQLLPFPINLTTLEQFFGRPFDAASAERFLRARRHRIDEPRNSEEYVLSRVGTRLYEAFYLNYTLKQWGIHPRDLDPSVCGRIPIRLNRDNHYVDHRFQIMPRGGFTKMFAKMLRHPKIQVWLNCDFQMIRRCVVPRRATLYTGPIDQYFDYRLGKLPYRSLRWDFLEHETEYKQPCVQINYPNEHAYTRSVEIKHATGQKHPGTVISLETPTGAGEPYYPIPASANAALYNRYKKLADAETRQRRVYYCGRLAQYRYFNTDEVIQEALKCFKEMQASCARGRPPSASSLATATI